MAIRKVTIEHVENGYILKFSKYIQQSLTEILSTETRVYSSLNVAMKEIIDYLDPVSVDKPSPPPIDSLIKHRFNLPV